MDVTLNLDSMSTVIKLAIPVDQVKIKVLLKISKSKKIFDLVIYSDDHSMQDESKKSIDNDAASIYSVSLIHMQRFNFRNWEWEVFWNMPV